MTGAAIGSVGLTSMSSPPDCCVTAAGVVGLTSMSRLCALAPLTKTRLQAPAAHPHRSRLRCHLVLDAVGMVLSSESETVLQHHSRIGPTKKRAGRGPVHSVRILLGHFPENARRISTRDRCVHLILIAARPARALGKPGSRRAE